MISNKDKKLLLKMLDMATDPDEALSFDELLGFLFGVAITPDMIMPSEWLPMVFGEEMFTIDTEEEGQQLLNELLGVVNDLAARFQEDRLRFPFDIAKLKDEDDLQPIQAWAFGFDQALMLRPECWLEEDLPELPTEEQQDLVVSVSVINALADPLEAEKFFETFCEGESEDEDPLQLIASLFMMLPRAVETLLAHASKLEEERRAKISSYRPALPQTRTTPKIGRNEPCPCGSGKKFKKCCLLDKKIVPIR
ncbi:MAG: UPF0149 family protein [Thermodesulfobacteriota bacterium]